MGSVLTRGSETLDASNVLQQKQQVLGLPGMYCLHSTSPKSLMPGFGELMVHWGLSLAVGQTFCRYWRQQRFRCSQWQGTHPDGPGSGYVRKSRTQCDCEADVLARFILKKKKRPFLGDCSNASPLC